MKISTVIDTNILIDILGPQSSFRHWSLDALKRCASEGNLVLTPVVWAELGAAPLTEEKLLLAFAWLNLERENLPFEAAFRAGQAHRSYRTAGGQRERTLADFLVGAHAEWHRHRLLTRDAARYRSYFPSLDIISPETHP